MGGVQCLHCQGDSQQANPIDNLHRCFIVNRRVHACLPLLHIINQGCPEYSRLVCDRVVWIYVYVFATLSLVYFCLSYWLPIFPRNDLQYLTENSAKQGSNIFQSRHAPKHNLSQLLSIMDGELEYICFLYDGFLSVWSLNVSRETRKKGTGLLFDLLLRKKKRHMTKYRKINNAWLRPRI